MADQADAATQAAGRMSFQLTYARSPTPRRFEPGRLTGPHIPCAYGNDIGSFGEWLDPRDDIPDADDLEPGDPQMPAAREFEARTEGDWIDRYANYAINEGVHEVLEWLRVDGRPWLDPHGPDEEEIYAVVNGMVDQLAAIRARELARG